MTRLLLPLAATAVLLVGCRPHGPQALYPEVPPGTPLIYVAPGGDDAAPGDAAHPLRSVAAAIKQAQPGSVIRLAPGEYRERIVIPTQATEAAPLIIEGARDANGQWLSVLDGSTLMQPGQWQPAPERGPHVYTALLAEPRLLLVDGEMVARLHPEAGSPGEKISAETVLGWPEDYLQTYREREVPFWETLGGVYTPRRDGKGLYLRLAGGVDPRQSSMAWAPTGGVVRLEGARFVTLRHLAIEGGEYGVEIGGPAALGNRVEECRIRHGRRRIRVADGAEGSLIVNNRLEMGFRGDLPGAWGAEAGSPQDTQAVARKAFLYNFFKYWASATSISDDVAVVIEKGSRRTVLEANTLEGGLIGIGLYGGEEVRVAGNRIRHFSSVGTVVRDGAVSAEYEGNLFYDCNLNIRLHRLNEPGTPARKLRFTSNVSIQEPGLGTHIFHHFLSEKYLRGTSPADYPEHEVLFAWNTFYGGYRGIAFPRAADATHGLPGWEFVNNRFIACTYTLYGHKPFFENRAWFGTFDYNEIAGGEVGIYGRPAWFGAHNTVHPSAEGWSAGPEGVTPAPGDAPRWLNLSAPFTLNGRSYAALPEPQPLPFYVYPAR